MSLISPLNLLFAGLLGAIVLLYMLRLKRRERVVPSNLLWQSAIRDLQANAPWQRLRSSLLMWLQLAFLALAVFALARPAIKIFSAGGQTVAIVLDGSASMGATDVAPSRFDDARSRAAKLVNGLSSGDAGTVLLAGARTRVLAPLTAEKNTLKNAVSRADNGDTTSDLREAIVLAASLLRDKKNPQIYVFSDGATSTLQDLDVGKVGLQFVKIGSGSDNLAITALDARRGYGGSDSTAAQVFATVSNYGDAPRKIDLELSRDGNLLTVRPMTIPAAQTKNGARVPGQASELFDDLRFDSGLFGAKFEAKDSLAADNVAWANLDPPRPISVLFAGDNLFLERALNLDPSVKLFVGAPPPGRAFDVVVCDGNVPPNLPDTNQFIFNAFTPLAPVEKIGVAQQPSVADYDRGNPVTRFAPWNDLRFVQSLAVKVKPWGKAVVEAERTPLVVVGEKSGKRVVWVGFDLRDSQDFPLRVAFPIFIVNSLRWLTAPRGLDAQNEGAPLRTGGAVPLYAPAKASEIAITGPDNFKTTIPHRSDGATVLFDGASKVGQYLASSGNWKQGFAVSLLDKSESDITPRDALKIGEQKTVAAENSARANKELWGYIILAALALLGLEWWVFHRGV